jgi:hypothetical protein
LASDGEMLLAMSAPVTFLGNSRLAPSGKVMVTFSRGCAGLRLDRLYWKPDSDLRSGDFGSDIAGLLKLTPANERR